MTALPCMHCSSRGASGILLVCSWLQHTGSLMIGSSTAPLVTIGRQGTACSQQTWHRLIHAWLPALGLRILQ